METQSDVLQFNNIDVTHTQKEAEMVQCPTCDTQIKANEVPEHCEQEMERLRQMKPESVAEIEAGTGTVVENVTGDERRKPWNVFRRVQHNRHSRLKQRTRKRTMPKPIEIPCPVCNVNFKESEIQNHTEHCLRRPNGVTNGGEGNSSNDDDESEEFEEYEWAGQKRIRASSLLVGGYASIGIGQSSNNSSQQVAEDEDLNVDEDDTQIYGPPQYGEADIIAIEAQCRESDDGDVTSYMRRLITGNTSATYAITASVKTESNDENKQNIPTLGELNTETNTDIQKDNKPAHYYQQIIASLKTKLRHFENHVQSKFKCLICLDEYRNPAVSVACWHVHCEECWLRALGARKLCPECNLITTPKDLRRIFI